VLHVFAACISILLYTVLLPAPSLSPCTLSWCKQSLTFIADSVRFYHPIPGLFVLSPFPLPPVWHYSFLFSITSNSFVIQIIQFPHCLNGAANITFFAKNCVWAILSQSCRPWCGAQCFSLILLEIMNYVIRALPFVPSFLIPTYRSHALDAGYQPRWQTPRQSPAFKSLLPGR